MPDIQAAAQQLAETLKKAKADYIEARLEESQRSHISYRGRELESVGQSAAVGGNIRALVRGGWGFVSFNDLDNLPQRIELAVKQARLVGKETSRLAPVKPIVDTVTTEEDSPLAVPLAEKKQLLDEYNQIIWSTPKLQTSVIGYADSHQKTTFLSSAGSHISQQRTDITLRLSAVAAGDGDVQQANLSLGSRGDFKAITGLHRQVEETAKSAVELLSAPQLKGGEYTIVLDPVLAGVFVHEAFGHLSEADHIYENERLREIMVLGKKFGGRELNIIDSAAIPDLRGSYKYDDEGVRAVKTYLIREGRLVGRLHSRETAAKMNESPTGNARALTYRFPPIVRMTNTAIEGGETSFEDLIKDIEMGVYACDMYGGQTALENFSFSSAYAYMIRHGQIAEMVKDVILAGNLFTTLMNIGAIGSDFEWLQSGGMCGKGQGGLPVTFGAPHIRIQNVVIGGK